MEEEKSNNAQTISFKVDAGLIDRLGRELVGRAETAVSELIKNAYDADATDVHVSFIDSNVPGGTLKIVDNGIGMDIVQLTEGFMNIASPDKIHNPVSIRFKRNKAGRKGIGRFATHRLGESLTIITQTKDSDKALKVTIDWNKYQINTDIASVKNPIELIEKVQEEGTVLLIKLLREQWTEKAIERVYRYVSDLLQPDYLSDRSRDLGLAKQKDESFKVIFNQITNGQEKLIADPTKMIFAKALATIEGYVDKDHNGYCFVKSDSLDVDSSIVPVEYNIDKDNPEPKYLTIQDIHFKAYYFIYNRKEYYTNISKIELKSIQNISSEQGGIRLYRNGFRVLPYGEPNNDWLFIDARWYDESGTNAPFGNHNLFGFVEVIDPEGKLFEETASREGLLENEAYRELKDFVSKALYAGRARLNYGVEQKRKKKEIFISHSYTDPNFPEKSPLDKLDDLGKQVNDITSDPTQKENTKRFVDDLKSDFQSLIEEIEMLRILAGLGLTIGEFTHEVVQFSPSINGDLSVISEQKLDIEGINALDNLKRTIRLFTSYTSYFNATVSANASRELKPQQVDLAVGRFKEIIEADLKKSKIELKTEFYGYELITLPMHSSEWSSILFNLYTNSKKAIKRANAQGKIRIVGGKENNVVYLEFSDNGDGIPEENKSRIFDAFFTTSSPVGFDAAQDERLTGTGLGLKIVKDIIQTYGGSIEVISPESGYVTCFRIELPIVNSQQKEEYGL